MHVRIAHSPCALLKQFSVFIDGGWWVSCVFGIGDMKLIVSLGFSIPEFGV